jgi:hypothetical protein
MSDHFTEVGGPRRTGRREAQGERRLWERYPAGATPAMLTWVVGEIEGRALGELRNLSGGGAAFVSQVMPPAHVAVWLRLAIGVPRADRIEPVESRLVRTSDDPSGAKIAHLEFVGTCPIVFFELVVDGLACGRGTGLPGARPLTSVIGALSVASDGVGS